MYRLQIACISLWVLCVTLLSVHCANMTASPDHWSRGDDTFKTDISISLNETCDGDMVAVQMNNSKGHFLLGGNKTDDLNSKLIISNYTHVGSTINFSAMFSSRCVAQNGNITLFVEVTNPMHPTRYEYASADIRVSDGGSQHITINGTKYACGDRPPIRSTQLSNITCTASDYYYEANTTTDTLMLAISSRNSTLQPLVRSNNSSCFSATANISSYPLQELETANINCYINHSNVCTVTITHNPNATTPNGGRSDAKEQNDSLAVIAGAGGGGAAIIIIVVVVVVVVVCLLRRRKTDEKAKRNDSQDECPYVVSGRAPLAGQNQYNSNDNRPPPQSPLYASTEVAKQGYNNGAMTPLSNGSTDDEGAPTAYGNIQPKVAAVDPAVIYSEPHKQKKQKKVNKSRKSDPIQEYANINNQLTDKQKGQYKQPDGTIYTEVSIDNNPSSAPGGSNSNAAAVNIRRRPDNPPTEYARVDFVKTKGGPGAADEGAAAAAPASPVYAEPAAVAAPPARDSDPPPAPPTKPPRLPQL